MAVYDFKTLLAHRGHNVEVAAYGDPKNPINVAIECMDCHEVLLDYDVDDEEEEA